MNSPGATQADQQRPMEEKAQAMFQRMVMHWAVDALSLRKRGLDRPSHRQGTSLGLAPGSMRIVYDDRPGPAPAIRWRPPADLAA